VLVVEAEHQQRAETTDLAVDVSIFAATVDGERRPVVAGAVFDRSLSLSGTSGAWLR